MMLDGIYPASMRLAHGAKDARLVTEAARGCELGHADEDMAAAYFAAIERAAR